jgi:hypothetical protein
MSIIQNPIIKATIIGIRNNVVIIKLITKAGIFFQILQKFTYNFLNCKGWLLVQNTDTNFNISSNVMYGLIIGVFSLFYYTRYYLKLRGLGFSFKYTETPKHILLLNIGFSRVRYIHIPQIISIIKKPRKKKYIFVMISANFNIFLAFTKAVRILKIPDPYKLKGFRYLQEHITTKTGKKKK